MASHAEEETIQVRGLEQVVLVELWVLFSCLPILLLWTPQPFTQQTVAYAGEVGLIPSAPAAVAAPPGPHPRAGDAAAMCAGGHWQLFQHTAARA